MQKIQGYAGHSGYSSRTSSSSGGSIWLWSMLLLAVYTVGIVLVTSSGIAVARADNFTDIFYTNSFRGTFEWVKKLDWVGMVVQMVISCFSLFGVALLVIRIMTSMLYLSAKGMWEEVHDLKSGGESEMFDFGFVNMAKSWAKGKAGTGLDAIIGAVLILLPDVKKYSDFGEKASGDFSDDMSISQYMLKIALPTVMTVFFFAMGFNGTLFQALAVTVDAMGTLADRAISVNYAGMIDDLVNSGTGYKFSFAAAGTNTGELQESVAKAVYGTCVSEISNPNANQLWQLGVNVENWVRENINASYIAENCATLISDNIVAGLNGDNADLYMALLGVDPPVINGSPEANGAITKPLAEFFSSLDSEGFTQLEGAREKYIHLFVRQTRSSNGSYFNLDGIASGGEG